MRSRSLIALAATHLLAACGVLDGLVEHVAQNRILSPSLTHCSEANGAERCEAAKSAFIVDLHADSLMWNRDIRRRSSIGHTD